MQLASNDMLPPGELKLPETSLILCYSFLHGSRTGFIRCGSYVTFVSGVGRGKLITRDSTAQDSTGQDSRHTIVSTASVAGVLNVCALRSRRTHWSDRRLTM